MGKGLKQTRLQGRDINHQAGKCEWKPLLHTHQDGYHQKAGKQQALSKAWKSWSPCAALPYCKPKTVQLLWKTVWWVFKN